MKEPNDKIIAKVRQWLDYADEDMKMASLGIDVPDESLNRLTAYHLQQSVEKNLKAYLVYCGVDFPYTHNISVLLEFCEKNIEVPAEIANAESLTPFAVSARYPGEDEEVSKQEVLEAFEIALKVRKFIRTNLNIQ
jgi:HEPN domain-containing protein